MAVRRHLVRAARIALRLALALLLITISLAGAALFALHTDRGRDWLRGQLQSALDDRFVGEVRIGRLEGSVFGDLVLHDLVIDNAAGQEAIRIDRLRADPALLRLLDDELRFVELVAQGVTVQGRRQPDGTLDLANLLVPSEEPSAWDVVIDDLRLTDASVSIQEPGGDVHLDALAGRGRLALRHDGGVDAVVDASAIWREPDLPVRIDAELGRRDEVVTVARADASLGELEVGVRALRIVGERVHGDVTVAAPAGAVRRLLPDSPLVGDVDLRLQAGPGPPGSAFQVAMAGTVGGDAVSGTIALAPSLPRAWGSLVVRALDVQAVVDGGPPTRLDGTIDFDVQVDRARQGLAAVSARLEVAAAGAIEGYELTGVELAAELADSHARARLRGSGAGGLVASVDGAAHIGPEAVRFEKVRVDARMDDLGALPVAADLRGSLRAHLAAEGRLGGGAPHLSGQGRIELRDAAYDGRRIGRLTVDARSRDDGAIAVAIDSRPLTSPWRIELDALVRPGEEAVRIALGKHRFRTHGVDWYGRGGRITVDDERVAVRGLTTHIAGGQVAVTGSYQHAGDRRGDLAAKVRAGDLDIAEVARSLELPPSWRGRIDATADVARRRLAWSGAVNGRGTGLRLREAAPPIDVRADARLGPRRIAVDAELGGAGLGRAVVALQIVPPRDYLRPAAWQHLDRHDVGGRIALAGLDLAGLAAAAGLEQPVVGRVDGELVLTRHQTHGWARGRGLDTGDLPAPVDVDLRLARESGSLMAVDLDVVLRGLVAGQVIARVELPRRPLDLAAWARLDAEAVHGLRLSIPELELDRRRSRILGLREPLLGRASVVAEVGAGARTGGAEVVVRRLRGGPLRSPVDARVKLRAGASGIEADLAMAAAGATLTGSGRVPVTLEELWQRQAPAPARIPIEGRIDLARSQVRPLLALTGSQQPMVGTITAEATIAGTVGAPTARGQVVVRELGVEAASLRELRATVAWDGALLSTEVRGARHDGGRLAIDATVDPGRPEQARGTLVARDFDLEPLARLGPGRVAMMEGLLTADLRVAGLGADTADLDGELRLRRARVPIDSRVGTLRAGQVDVVLRDGRVRLSMDGKIGRGTVRLHATGVTRGLVPQEGELHGVIRNVVLLAELQPEIDGALHARLRRAGDTWRVTAAIRRGRVDIPRLEADPLHEPGTPPDMVIIENGVPPPRTVDPQPAWRAALGHRPSAPWLRVDVDIEPVIVQSDELRGQVSGDLQLVVGDDGIALDGRISVAEGSMVLFDRRYRVERAELRFAGGPDPTVDVQLVHEFPEMALYVSVTGPASDPKLELSSRPATYSEGQLLSILLGASPGQEGSPELRDAATSLAASMISRKIGGYVEGYLPVELDVLRFKAATASESASFTVGKWITRKLFLAYERRLAARPEQNAGEAEIEYWLYPSVILEAQIGDRGHHALDLLWLNRW